MNASSTGVGLHAVVAALEVDVVGLEAVLRADRAPERLVLGQAPPRDRWADFAQARSAQKTTETFVPRGPQRRKSRLFMACQKHLYLPSLFRNRAGTRSPSEPRHPRPDSFTFLGCHALPALGHATAEIGAMRTVAPKSAEEDPAQRQKSKRLPEGDLAPAEERRQQPVPQLHDDFAADER